MGAEARFSGAQPKLGVAWSPDVGARLGALSDAIDFVELSFEQLRQDPKLYQIRDRFPVVLHCASLSVAGFVDPDPATLREVVDAVERTGTPWLGEHLAFVTADPETLGNDPVNIGFTLCPQLSERTLDRLCDNIARIGEEFRVPLLLENPPQYLDMPGSTMTLPTFVRRMCERTDVSLLIDVTHLYIAASNAGWDPYEALDQWPMERVVEVHISGASYASGLWWDNHATAAPEDVMALFAEVMRRTRPRAVTLEYNWVPHIPGSFLLEQIARVREVIGGRP